MPVYKHNSGQGKGREFCRVENESCITASNLFKYAFPCHGLVLFKHHNPLEFSETQVPISLLDNLDFKNGGQGGSDWRHEQPMGNALGRLMRQGDPCLNGSDQALLLEAAQLYINCLSPRSSCQKYRAS